MRGRKIARAIRDNQCRWSRRLQRSFARASAAILEAAAKVNILADTTATTTEAMKVLPRNLRTIAKGVK